MGPKPTLIAIVISDYVAPGLNGKLTLVGTCFKLRSKVFPAKFASLGFFLSMNSVPNRGKINLFMVHESGAPSIKLPEIEILKAPEDRREIFQTGGLLNNITFPTPGMWEIRALWNGDLIGTHPLWVELMEEAKHD